MCWAMTSRPWAGSLSTQTRLASTDSGSAPIDMDRGDTERSVGIRHLIDERTAEAVTAAVQLGRPTDRGDHLRFIHTRDSALDAAAIEVRGLRKIYRGGVEALKGIDFEVLPGEVFGLLGPNGAGKSTTVGMLTTTIVPTAGTAQVAGYDVVTQPLRARSVSSVVLQQAVVDTGLTGRANLDLHARLWGVPRGVARTRIADLVDAPHRAHRPAGRKLQRWSASPLGDRGLANNTTAFKPFFIQTNDSDTTNRTDVFATTVTP